MLKPAIIGVVLAVFAASLVAGSPMPVIRGASEAGKAFKTFLTGAHPPKMPPRGPGGPPIRLGQPDDAAMLKNLLRELGDPSSSAGAKGLDNPWSINRGLDSTAAEGQRLRRWLETLDPGSPAATKDQLLRQYLEMFQPSKAGRRDRERTDRAAPQSRSAADTLLDFFTRLTGGADDELRKLSAALAKFGSAISREFCTEFVSQEAPAWLQVGDLSRGPVLKPPRFEGEAGVEARERERVRLRTRLAEFARDRCIDWPAEVWSNDPRLVADSGPEQLYPGRIVVPKAGDFRGLRNRFPRAHIVLRHSKDPARGLASLSVVPRSLRLAFDAPQTMADAARMYGDAELPLSWAHQSRYYRSSLERLGGRSLAQLQGGATGKTPSMADVVRQMIRTKAPHEALVLVAHCEHGFLRFSDGSRLPVSEVRQQDALSAPTIIMACDTLTHFGDEPGLTFATAKSISFDEAIWNTQAIQRAVEKQEPIGEAFRAMQMHELEQEGFKPDPAAPAPTGQASTQLVEATNAGVITIHSDAVAIARLLPAGVLFALAGR